MRPAKVQQSSIQRRSLRLTGAALALACAAVLAGCSGSFSSLLDGSSPASEPVALRTEGKAIARMIAYRPAMGPPEDVGNELSRQLNDAATEHGIALILDTSTPTDLAMRGYLTAMRKGPSINITYLWDVVDARGQRVHRVSGEEVLSNGVDIKQPWAAVTPAVARMIAQKAMGEIGKWTSSLPVAAPSASTRVPLPGAAALAPRSSAEQ